MVGVGTNQHYVPKFYLKRFSKNKLVSVYSKKSKCFFSTLKAIKSRSSSLGFYDDFTNDGDVTDIIDQALKPVEDKTSKILECLHGRCIDSKNHNMTPILCIQQKNDLSVFLTLQLLRTSKVRNALHCFADAVKAKLRECAGDNSRVFPNIVVDGKSIQLEALRNTENLIYYQNYLLDARWVLVYNDTNIPFITSDNPVYSIPLKNEIGVMGITPFFSEDREICFPIFSENLSSHYSKRNIWV